MSIRLQYAEVRTKSFPGEWEQEQYSQWNREGEEDSVFESADEAISAYLAGCLDNGIDPEPLPADDPAQGAIINEQGQVFRFSTPDVGLPDGGYQRFALIPVEA